MAAHSTLIAPGMINSYSLKLHRCVLLFALLSSLAIDCLTAGNFCASASAVDSADQNKARAAIALAEPILQGAKNEADNHVLQNIVNLSGQLITRHPDDPEWYVLRARALLALKPAKVTDAFADLNRAVKLKPDYTFALLIRGKAWMQSGRSDAAIEEWTVAVDKFEAFDCAFALGDYYFKRNADQQAICWFDRAAALDPTMSAPQYMKGICCRRMLEDTKAIDALTKAIALNAKFPTAENRKNLAASAEARGNLYMTVDKYEAAIADLSKALALNPNLWDAHRSRAKCYLKLHKDQNGLADFTTLLKSHPNPQVSVERARLYERAGQYDLAIQDCTTAINSGDKSVASYQVRANSYRAQKKFALALADIEKAIKLDDYTSTSLALKAEILAAMGDKVGADKVRKEAKELDTDLGPGKR